MPAHTLSRSRCQSWVDAIPLGSLDQLQHATTRNVQGEQLPADATSVALPESRPDSIDRSHHSDAAAPSTIGSGSDATRKATLQAHPPPGISDPGEAAPAQAAAAQAAAAQAAANVPASQDSAWNTASAGSLWQLQNTGTAAEFEIPLPSSAPASHEYLHRVGTGTESEVVVAETLHVDSQVAVTASSQRGRPLVRQPDEPNYWQRVSSLRGCLPHLEIIDRKYGRHRDIGTVTCIDYFRGSDQPEISEALAIDQFHSRRAYSDRIRELRMISNPEIATRVLLVEDLSPGLIALLGSTFEIDPESFAEHLNRSGYNVMDYEDGSPAYWETRNMLKGHASMKWYRPVRQNATVTGWLQNPTSLLNKRTVGKIGDEKIVRGGIAWNDFRFGGPKVQPVGRPGEFTVEHQAVVTTNIFRRSWSLSARPTGHGQKLFSLNKPRPGHRDGELETVAHGPAHTAASMLEGDEFQVRKHESIPTAWEEKACCIRYCNAIAPIIILLLDPLPAISDHQKMLVSRRTRVDRNGSSRMTAHVQPVEMCLPMVPRMPLDFPRNKFKSTTDDIAQLKHSIDTLPSTADAVKAQLGRAGLETWQAFKADPILALLRVVQIDSKALFQSLESALDEISQDSLDDYLMTRRLADWRRMMSDFEIEVPAIGKSLRDFVEFVFGSAERTELPKEISSIVKGLDADILRLKQRLDEAYTALRADMQFTESRRSINEAKTVTKLTELAFIFIPLSFTSSLFSMSIRELQNGVRVWTFVLTALAMTLIAFGIRLLVASDFIADSSRSALERFWARRNVRRGDSAPVLTLVTLTAQEVWRNGGAGFAMGCVSFLFVSAFIVVPVAFLWTSTRLDVGFNVAMTLLFVLSGLAFALLIAVGLDGIGDTGERVSAWFSRPPDTESMSSAEDV